MFSTGSFNNQIKQVIILGLLILMIFLSVRELYIFFPGLLGALTLYILGRNSYFQLVYKHKWKKGWTAGLYLLGFTVILSGLIWFTVVLVEKQVHPFFADPAASMNKIRDAVQAAQENTGITMITAESLTTLQQKLSALIPSLLNDTTNLVINLAILLFVLYYMLVNGKEMESYIAGILPLKHGNVELLASETKRIVRASALGIPLISIIQGVTATIGYMIFGPDNVILWGFLTGIFAFFPVIGTMVIWVPLVIFMYASGDTWNATGLMLYSFIITGNVDYLARITLLKKLGQIHPVVTVLGVLVGLGLFGFIGLIFGPLLVDYIILLFRIYKNEFIAEKE